MPMADKLHGGVGKAPLRAAFADQIPAAVTRRAKRPFAAPATAWMEGALRPLVLERLAPDALALLPGLDPATAGAVWSAFRDNLPVRQERIWTLLNFALWAESFGVAEPSALPTGRLEPARIT
jgi:hypothetical protein